MFFGKLLYLINLFTSCRQCHYLRKDGRHFCFRFESENFDLFDHLFILHTKNDRTHIFAICSCLFITKSSTNWIFCRRCNVETKAVCLSWSRMPSDRMRSKYFWSRKRMRNEYDIWIAILKIQFATHFHQMRLFRATQSVYNRSLFSGQIGWLEFTPQIVPLSIWTVLESRTVNQWYQINRNAKFR